MIVTAWLIDPATGTIVKRVIYNEPATNPGMFLNDICVRNPGMKVEIGPISETGWGRWNR
jgi:hypothetical protein